MIFILKFSRKVLLCYCPHMKRSKTQTERLIDLDIKLRAGKYPNCSSFAADWEISTKTAQRDFDFLRDRMNAPIEYDALKRGYFYTESTFMMPAMQMNEGELVALLMGTKALQQFQGTPLAKKLSEIFEKLSALLPETVSLRPEELFTQFSFTSPPAMVISQKTWLTVVLALQKQQMLEIRYRNWKGERVYRVAPVHLANLQGDWYLFVQFEDCEDFRQIALARIQSARQLNRKIKIAGVFNPEKELANTFSRFAGQNKPFQAVLRFSKYAAEEILERPWHPKQKIKQLKDGEIEISFETKGDIEIKRWALAFGRHAKVKSPKWLKDQIEDEVRAMHTGFSG